MKPPTRLLDDPSTSAQLRVDLAHATSAAEPYDLTRGLAQLEAALDEGAAELGDDGEATRQAVSEAVNPVVNEAVSGIRATKPKELSLRHAAKARHVFSTLKSIKAGLLLLAGASAVGLVALSAERATPTPAAVESAKRSSESVLPSSPAVASTASSAEQSATREAPAKASPTDDSASRREIAQLLRIRQLLERAPAAAYRLAQASQREFPNGALREEREGLALLALWQLEAREPARRLTREFLERYPESPLRERLQRLLASSQGL